MSRLFRVLLIASLLAGWRSVLPAAAQSGIFPPPLDQRHQWHTKQRRVVCDLPAAAMEWRPRRFRAWLRRPA